MKSVPNLFLANLAFADLLLILFCVPIKVSHRLAFSSKILNWTWLWTQWVQNFWSVKTFSIQKEIHWFADLFWTNCSPSLNVFGLKQRAHKSRRLPDEFRLVKLPVRCSRYISLILKLLPNRKLLSRLENASKLFQILLTKRKSDFVTAFESSWNSQQRAKVSFLPWKSCENETLATDRPVDRQSPWWPLQWQLNCSR